ncbi:MAG: glycosyltransferase [Flavobacterium sp.]|nr:MAG: glycosyltransferase [Flavobacterium sp.]
MNTTISPVINYIEDNSIFGNMPKISIITVNLNNLSGLQKTVKSILSQTFKEFEFIIVDGNSTDGSKEYIQEVSENLSQWISEPDKGIYNAMNKGIRMAKGEYLCFLNSGDIFLDNSTLEKVHSKLSEEADIYYGDVVWDQVNKKRIIPAPKKLSYPFLLTHNVNHQSCFIKKTLFDDIFYYNENFHIISDWEFLIYAVCKKQIPTKHLEMTVSVYDASGISSDVKNKKAICADRRSVIEKHFPLFGFDSEEVAVLFEKRGIQFLHIKKYKFAYRMLKWFMSLLMVFLPKNQD